MVGGFDGKLGELLTRRQIEGGGRRSGTGPSGSFGWSRQDLDVITPTQVATCIHLHLYLPLYPGR